MSANEMPNDQRKYIVRRKESAKLPYVRYQHPTHSTTRGETPDRRNVRVCSVFVCATPPKLKHPKLESTNGRALFLLLPTEKAYAKFIFRASKSACVWRVTRAHVHMLRRRAAQNDCLPRVFDLSGTAHYILLTPPVARVLCSYLAHDDARALSISRTQSNWKLSTTNARQSM